MFKDITASLVAATRKVVEASSAKAAEEAKLKEQSSNLSKTMKPAYEGLAPRNAQERSLISEKKAHTVPKTDKEKDLAALAEPKDKITHADVMTGRGVKKEEKEDKEPVKKLAAFDYKSPRKPQDAPNRKSGDVTMTGHDVKKISTGTVYTKRFEEVEQLSESVHVLDDEGETHVHVPDAKSVGELDKAVADHLKKHHGFSHQDVEDHYHDGYYSNVPYHHEKPEKGSKPDVVRTKAEHVKSVSDRVAEMKKDSDNETHESVKAYGKAISEAPVDGVAPGSMEGKKHMCASKVMHKEWKEGKTLFSQHAEPNEIGLIEWYDVMFEHGIEKKVPTRDLEIMVSESHMNHKKKM